jgi:MFS family permease
MSEQLKCSEPLVNLSLIVFFIFLSISSIFWGPLSDKYGRRPIMLAGVILYTVSSAFCVFSGSIMQLISARIFQAVGAGAAMAVNLAIIKDVFPGRRRERTLAWVSVLNGVIPVIAPSIGAQILKLTSWRGIFGTFTLIGALICIFALFLTSGCRQSAKSGGTASLRRLNVVLVTVDTLRPDRLGCYGNRTVATPNLDRLAQGGALFENAVTQTPLTAPSHASIFTGTNPTVHKVRDTGGFVLQTAHPTLAEILGKQGWATAAFVGSSVLKKGSGFQRGFTVYDDQMPKPEPGRVAGDYAERRAGEVVDHAVKWLEGQAGQPFFLWVHVFDPHSPYDPPSPFREQ